jgi:hypothetical protein
VCVTVICIVWRRAMALQFNVITGVVLKWSTNPIFNPKPRRESLDYVTICMEQWLNDDNRGENEDAQRKASSSANSSTMNLIRQLGPNTGPRSEKSQQSHQGHPRTLMAA